MTDYLQIMRSKLIDDDVDDWFVYKMSQNPERRLQDASFVQNPYKDIQSNQTVVHSDMQ